MCILHTYVHIICYNHHIVEIHMQTDTYYIDIDVAFFRSFFSYLGLFLDELVSFLGSFWTTPSTAEGNLRPKGPLPGPRDTSLPFSASIGHIHRVLKSSVRSM